MAIKAHPPRLVRHPLIDGVGEVVWETDNWTGVRYQERPPSNITLAAGARPVYRTVALRSDQLEVIT
jgi:hypothetical protein